MRQMRSALRAAGVSRWKCPVSPKVGGPPSPAFVAMVFMGKVVDVATELRNWHSKSGKLWRAWKKLDADSKAAMVRMGRRVMVEVVQ